MTEFDPTPEPDPARPACEPARAALQRLLDGEPTWDAPEAAAHRAGCVDCREELALARSLARLPAPVFPAELAGRVHAATVTAHRRRRFVRHAAGGALAASVLVAVFALRPTPQTVIEWRTAAAVARPKNEGVAAKPLGEAVSEARDALVSLTRRTAAETQATSAVLIPSPKMPDVPDGGDGLEPLAEARAGAARSVEPIQTSARRAFNLFLRAADPPNKSAVQ